MVGELADFDVRIVRLPARDLEALRLSAPFVFARELEMELAAQIPRMVGELADFDVRIVRRLARDLEARRLQALFVFAIELVAVAMALVDFARAVGVVSDAALGQAASPASQPHGAAQLVDTLEFAQL